MTDETPRAELEAIVAEYRHLRENQRRSRSEGRLRRRAEKRLHELELGFERLLDEWVPGGGLRDAWRLHLHRAGPAPAEPVARGALVFRGAADTGSVAEVRERPDGDCDVVVDGVLCERVEADLDFSATRAPHPFRLDRLVFRETFGASAEALAALGEFVAERAPHPPWRFAPELRADGLIDAHFGLTARGHRALRR